MQKRLTQLFTLIITLTFALSLRATYAFGHSNSIWPEIADHFDLPSASYHSNVRRQIYWLTHNPANFEQLTENAKPYIYYVYQQTRKKHLPAELALLPMLESNYKPFTYSQVGAVGLWQLMPGTATGEGITMNWWYDGRRDVVASTEVALNYLSYLHKMLNNNWLLAIAAYDAGAGTILNAIHYNREHGRSTDFWSLPLPKETRQYVPRLIAIADILRHPSYYHIHLPFVANTPYLGTATIDKQMDLSAIAKAASVSLSEVQILNPGFRRLATPPNQKTTLVLPISHIHTFLSKIKAQVKSATAKWIHYKVQPGDTLSTIAKKFKTTINAIKQANNLHNHIIRVFHAILIPEATKQAIKAIIHSKISKSIMNEDHLPGPQQVIYSVTSHDSFSRIAHKYHVKIAQIRYWNNLTQHHVLKKGEKLILWTGQHHAYKPGFHTYAVVPDDTLSVIAEKNHTTVSRLKKLNHLRSDILNIGQRLTIPNS